LHRDGNLAHSVYAYPGGRGRVVVVVEIIGAVDFGREVHLVERVVVDVECGFAGEAHVDVDLADAVIADRHRGPEG